MPSQIDVTSPAVLATGPAGPIQVILTMPPETFAALSDQAARSGQPLEDVIAKAFALYRAAAEAQHAGKAVGVAPSAAALETEFVGL